MFVLSIRAAQAAGAPVIATMVMGPLDVAGLGMVCGMIAVVMFPFARAVARSIEARTNRERSLAPDVSDRLDRIERAVESVALEVERISEGQRFVTKLLAERAPDRLPKGGPPS